MGRLAAPVLAGTECSQANSAWDQPFLWHSAGSEPQQPVAVCFGAFHMVHPVCNKTATATVGKEISKA